MSVNERFENPADRIIAAHTVVSNGKRRVEVQHRSFDTPRGPSHTVSIVERRVGHRRFAIDLPVSAIGAAIEALEALEASVTRELGAGTTRRRASAHGRNAPTHGTWTPTDGRPARTRRLGVNNNSNGDDR